MLFRKVSIRIGKVTVRESPSICDICFKPINMSKLCAMQTSDLPSITRFLNEQRQTFFNRSIKRLFSRLLFSFLTVLGFASISGAAVFTSVTSGNLTDGATWGNQYPEGDPLSKNPASTNTDLMDLSAGSPAYYNAFVIGAMTNDIYLVDRPINPAIGAFDNIYVLSIALLHFDAIKNEDATLLEWATATEIENLYFTLERSTDAKEWQTIGTLTGAVNSSETRHYNFVDYAPIQGTNYYRLKHTNWDGTSTHSQIKAVDFSASASTFSVYPNPAASFVNVEVPEQEQEDEELCISLYSEDGSLISKSILRSNRLDIQDLSKGIYLIQITSSKDVPLGTQRMVVQ
jgi:hypothetical protein